MKEKIHPKYVDAEIRCACGNVIKTRSTKPVIIVGICNACHPFYTGQQKFVDTAGRVENPGRPGRGRDPEEETLSLPPRGERIGMMNYE
jgi:large subunit ribosomal protein L31